MPELPEVETLRRSLEPALLGRRITNARLSRRNVLTMPGDPPGGWSRAADAPTPRRYRRRDLLVGDRVVELRRRGKQLAIVSDSGRSLLVHLGMTGALLWGPRGRRLETRHRHASWRLDNGSNLVFVDPRRFGGLWSLPDPAALDARWAPLGPDALALTPEALAAAFGSSRRPVKAALLDQLLVAGVGNIYADESLFRARVHPERPAARLSPDQTARLANAITEVLRAAIEGGGSTLRDYRDANGRSGAFQTGHLVYGRGGLPCVLCGTPLRQGVIAQRTTVWCPRCQAPGRSDSQTVHIGPVSIASIQTRSAAS